MNGAAIPEPRLAGGAPLGRLDAVLAAAHMIPQQKDVSAILQMVKYSSLPLLHFQRLGVMIETPLRERSRLYAVDVITNSSTCQGLSIQAGDESYALFQGDQAHLLQGAELARELGGLSRLAPFAEATAALLLPLPVGVNGYHALLTFIWVGEELGHESVLPLCRVIGGIVAAALTQVLLEEERNMELEALRSERDRLNILVGIINVANSTLNLRTLIDRVRSDLLRFFAVLGVGVILNEGEGMVSLYGVGHSGRGREPVIRCEDSLLGLLSEGEAVRLLREPALRQVRATDPLAAQFVAGQAKVVCVVRLRFREREFGALVLAHTTADVMTRETITLLSQIAQSVAGAVANAREYAVVDSSRQRLAEENALLVSEIAQKSGDAFIVGQSAAVRKMLHQIALVAASDSTVLLLGETGTGKELVAEAIHARSPRKARPMVKVNCAAVPAGLLESELFGHERGSFTGAVKQSKGRFELAQGSTLFLDEVGDLPLDLQPKLLRILQSRELERVGGHAVIPLDVRLVAATNQNLVEMVQEKRFREDLYYRLNVFPIHLPPLRERREDIPLLTQHFMEQMSRRMKKDITRISAQALRWLCAQEWPGNVRELANVIERAVICSSGKVLHLEPDVVESAGSRAVQGAACGVPEPGGGTRTGFEQGKDMREAIIRAVRACNGLIAGPRGAAALLGVNRTTLNSRMKRLGLTVKSILQED